MKTNKKRGKKMRTNEEIIQILMDKLGEKNISMSELARRTGIAKSTLSRYFNKTREFPLNRADTFAKVLGITTEYLLGMEATPTKEPTPTIDFKEMAAESMSYDGMPLNDEDIDLIASILETRMKNRDKE
ncbi:helix-turn-helix domain-containing protein [Streptococcus suis]|uniref:helix-turn-helix domain-containing protein n=2 Tax=Streptococcus suis TaxID=1307 RepID=UPI001EF975DE|nr:helix-turn-helix domain-containing protein [Streptococcus suis]